jgi:GxxExxY protein
MPVHLREEIRQLNQEEFGDIAYEVMAHLFAIHRDLGRLFDEKIYQKEIARRLPNAQREVPIEICFDGFKNTCFLDLLVEGGAIFELKAVESLSPRHRAQLLNYLLLTETAHGKLVNMRPEKVSHEFVNTTLTRTDRTNFVVEDHAWLEIGKRGLKEWTLCLLYDWGVGLDLLLYEEAIGHFCGPDTIAAKVDIHSAGQLLGVQTTQLTAPDVALRLSAVAPDRQPDFEAHLRRFLSHTPLRAIQWINLTRPLVQFKTIR